MSWNSRILALLVVLPLGCTGEVPEPADTSGTNRDLLTGTTEGGPFSQGGGDPDVAALVTRAFLPDLGYNLGVEEAPLKVIEFADFGCGYCRQFHEQTLPTVLEEFVDSGQIEWKLITYVTGQFQNSLPITEAAECTLEQDDEAYLAIADRVWESQGEWKPSDDPESLLREWAEATGIDMEAYDACLSEDRQMNRIAGATAIAQQLGIRGTPTFWIVGFGPLQGALPLDVFRNVLTAVLEEVEAADSSGLAGPDSAE